MANGDIAKILKVITQKLENLEKIKEKSEEEKKKTRQDKRWDAIAKMALQVTRKSNFPISAETPIHRLSEIFDLLYMRQNIYYITLQIFVSN